MIVVVDYGMANTGSVINMLKKVGASAVASAEANVILAAEKLILPGVGAFDNAVRRLRELGLVDALNESAVQRGIPTLGICLGMQLLLEHSEEGELPGLGWIEGRCERFSFPSGAEQLRVPHMGWNEIRVAKGSAYFEGVGGEQRFYFVHSYHAVCGHDEDILATATYGYEFPVAVERGNIAGVQFHPEKSHRFGMRLLGAFSEL